MNIKREIRVIGIDDGPFNKNKDKKVLIVGAVLRAASQIDGVLSTYVKLDGLDATSKIINLIKKSRHFGQLRIIMLNGICVAGFNPIDIKKLHEKTNFPVIIVTRNKPDKEKLKDALAKLKDFKKKWKAIENAGEVNEIKIQNSKLYFQFVGIKKQDVEKLIKLTAKNSIVPEPVRVAHLIAGGIVSGESKGRV